MTTAVQQFIKKHLAQSCRILVGLSGGADSVALLLALKEAGAHCVAAHCNFHLRGEESDRDMKHCMELCDSLGVKLLIKHFDVTARRAATAESLEMACRALRYDWWNELIASGTCDYIAVGHHREDNVETFFINLLRGSGINGLKGMLPVNGNIIRPLLKTSRADIEKYVSEKGFSWVDDHTNFENEYKRNKLRNIILPEIERLFPGATDAMVKSLDILRDNYTLYRTYINEKARKYILANGSIDVSGIVNSEAQHSTLLYEMLSPKGFTPSQIENLIKCCDGTCVNAQSGQLFVTPSCTFVLERGILSEYSEKHNIKKEERFRDLISPALKVSTLTTNEFNSLKQKRLLKPDSVYLDSNVMNGSPEWCLRTWHKGDRLSPFGMKGSRLVSDIFKDAKFTQDQKDSTLLLFRNDELIWIAGVRASRHFPITEQTQSVIQIKLR